MPGDLKIIVQVSPAAAVSNARGADPSNPAAEGVAVGRSPVRGRCPINPICSAPEASFSSMLGGADQNRRYRQAGLGDGCYVAQSRQGALLDCGAYQRASIARLTPD